MPLDPISGVLGGVQMLGGLAQSLFSGKKKQERKLEQLANSYQKNQSIMDYYGKALSKYNANPYTSASYRNATQSANRGLSAGLGALGDRRSLLGGLGSLMQQYNDSSLRAAGQAEQQSAQALNQLGNATQMKAAEDRVPFDLKYNLQAQKAAGANATKAAGLQNMFGGLGTIASGFTPGLGKKKSTTLPSLNNGWMSGYKDEIINPPF